MTFVVVQGDLESGGGFHANGDGEVLGAELVFLWVAHVSCARTVGADVAVTQCGDFEVASRHGRNSEGAVFVDLAPCMPLRWAFRRLDSGWPDVGDDAAIFDGAGVGSVQLAMNGCARGEREGQDVGFVFYGFDRDDVAEPRWAVGLQERDADGVRAFGDLLRLENATGWFGPGIVIGVDFRNLFDEFSGAGRCVGYGDAQGCAFLQDDGIGPGYERVMADAVEEV
ncbi:MAG: hypothetical protein JWO95_3359 [Verrucomicrobiales bacterium]|nr:hypothetical protein [Verrucomicrobiales bacterium]